MNHSEYPSRDRTSVRELAVSVVALLIQSMFLYVIIWIWRILYAWFLWILMSFFFGRAFASAFIIAIVLTLVLLRCLWNRLLPVLLRDADDRDRTILLLIATYFEILSYLLPIIFGLFAIRQLIKLSFYLLQLPCVALARIFKV